MELRLANEIYQRHQDWSLDKIEEVSNNIADYWIDSCLDDVLEASEN